MVGVYVHVVVCTDLSGKEVHCQVGVGIVVTSGSLSGVIAANWRRIPDMWV